MDVFRRLGDWRWLKLRLPFGQKKFKEKPSPLNKYDYYVYKFQSIVVWEHPSQTVSCLLLIQLLFWMIVNLCWKFYGILFTVLLIFCTHDVWTEKIWPEIRLPPTDAMPLQRDMASNPRFLSTGQIQEYFDNLLLHAKMTLIRLRNLRSTHPTAFCAMFASYLTLLAVFGCTISGIWLLYMTVMTILLSPGVYMFLLPEWMKTCVKRYLCKYLDEPKLAEDGFDDVDEDEEYVPELSEQQMIDAYLNELYYDDSSNDFFTIDKDDVPSADHLSSYDDGLDEMDRLSDVAKMSVEFSETSSAASDISALERARLLGENFEVDDTSNDEDEVDLLPGSQCPRRESESSALGAFVSNLTLPDLNLMSRINVWTSMMASVPQTLPPSPFGRPFPSLAALNLSTPNTDDEFEFINESDLN